MSRGSMHSAVSLNHCFSSMIVMLVSWLHSESARVWKNCTPSDTLLYESSMKSELKQRLLMMAWLANSNSMLLLVAGVIAKESILSV